jgi:hypothetical protein
VFDREIIQKGSGSVNKKITLSDRRGALGGLDPRDLDGGRWENIER